MDVDSTNLLRIVGSSETIGRVRASITDAPLQIRVYTVEGEIRRRAHAFRTDTILPLIRSFIGKYLCYYTTIYGDICQGNCNQLQIIYSQIYLLGGSLWNHSRKGVLIGEYPRQGSCKETPPDYEGGLGRCAIFEDSSP